MLDWDQHRGILSFDFGPVSVDFHTCVMVASHALTLRTIHTSFHRREPICPNVVPICRVACNGVVLKAYSRQCGTAGTYEKNDRYWKEAFTAQFHKGWLTLSRELRQIFSKTYSMRSDPRRGHFVIYREKMILSIRFLSRPTTVQIDQEITTVAEFGLAIDQVADWICRCERDENEQEEDGARKVEAYVGH